MLVAVWGPSSLLTQRTFWPTVTSTGLCAISPALTYFACSPPEVIWMVTVPWAGAPCTAPNQTARLRARTAEGCRTTGMATSGLFDRGQVRSALGFTGGEAAPGPSPPFAVTG